MAMTPLTQTRRCHSATWRGTLGLGLMLYICAALLHSAPVIAEEALGRLFLTPERRALLERQRQLNIRQAQVLEGETITINGVVRRSNGKGTTWVNGIAQHDRETPTGIQVSATPGEPAQVSLSSDEEAPQALKTGESINRSTREVQDGLGGGRIIIKKTPGSAPAARP